MQYLGVSLAVIKLRFEKNDEFKIPGGELSAPLPAAGIIIFFLSKMNYAETMGDFIFTVLLTIAYFINKKVIKHKSDD